jgi:hypothetical protein
MWANQVEMRHLSQKISCRLEIEPWNRRVGAEKSSTVVSFQEKHHGPTSATVEKLFKRAKILLSWHADDEIFFSDEKLLVLEQQLNVQNDRVWSVSLSDIPREKSAVPRYQNASTVMMWGAISRKGRLPLVFINRGAKINAEYYKTEFLQRILLSAAKIL